MAFTFDPGLVTTRDQARFHLGDTDPDEYYVEDATLDALLLVSRDDPLRAAHAAAQYVVAKTARLFDGQMDAVNERMSQVHEHYAKTVLPEIRRKMAVAGTPIWAAGLTLAEGEALASNTGAVQPYFTRTRP